ncbi:hypothetical protein [Chryseobacterium sp. SIMBA_029]|uniref:hypothetical protein n=1 Tax=Chryseobacterium sp. SIMBA_029 TaxID=3085772 RepID=UPI003979C7A5
MKNLEITESIKYRKLVFDENYLDKLDTFTIYLAFISLIVISVILFGEITPSKNNSLEYIILISVISFSFYGLYCKATEKTLKEIKFNIHKEDAKQRILEYGKKYNYRISKISNDLIFFNEPTDVYNSGHHEMTTIIFFKDDAILYTLIKEGAKINAPVLLSQHLTRLDLKKTLNKTKNTNTGYFSSLFHG